MFGKAMKCMTVALLIGGWVTSATQVPAQKPDPQKTILVEVEWFQLQGDWMYLGWRGQKGLWSMAGEDDPITVVEIPQAGDYAIWTQAYDFSQKNTGTRRYLISIDEQPVEKEAGDHGEEGWRWQKVGQRQLAAGEHVLRIQCTTSFPRADAILLTTEDLDPNNLTAEDRLAMRVRPTEVELRRIDALPEPAGVDEEALKETVALENAHLRIVFLEGKDAEGKPRIVRRTEIKSADGPLVVPSKNENLYLLHSDDSGLNVASLSPAWGNGGGRMEFESAGKTYQTKGEKQNPFLAGEPALLVPRACRKEADAVRVEYESVSGEKLSGLWTLPRDARHVHFAATYTASRDGEFMLAFTAFDEFDPKAIEQVQLPPRYQYQHLPAVAKIVTDSVAAHPMAMVQARMDGRESPITLAVTGDMAHIPFEWPCLRNATYGFALKNHHEQVQPCLFQPVLGLETSKRKKGETIEVAWNVLAWASGWEDAFEYASDHLFQVKDTREPWSCSLSDAVLNMFDLMADEDAGGWDPNLRGRWNIESQATVSHTAPLMELSVALLTRDEAFYEKYALPSIEYTLSRPFTHFSKGMQEEESWLRASMLDMTVPSQFFDSAYWQGAHEMLGHANPWAAGYARSETAVTGVTNSAKEWARLLAQYRLDPTPELLAKVRESADAFIAKEIYGVKDGDFIDHFYNLVFAPYWFDLVDLYEVTHDEKYLKAAEAGAFLTMTGQFSIPAAPEGEVTIHKGFYENFKDQKAWSPWFKGEERFSLGWPITKENALPEKTVPAWVVSRVGYSFEGPGTYQGGGEEGKGVKNIQLSCWAPDLLRVGYHTGRDIYTTYARNTTVGRWANWPGYYISRFTDITQDPRYPYQGPDVTSFYFHQIPAHTAYAMEYLVAEAETRSDYKIRFPYVRQQGYVWMTNRIYGQPGGEIFGDGPIVPRVSRGVRADSKMINVLLARSEKNIWVILTNDAHHNVKTQINIDPTDWSVQGLQPSGKIRVLDAEGKMLRSLKIGGPIQVEVPALGLTALSFPARAETIDTAPPALPEESHLTQDLGEPWGQVHAFRIRGPFGKDSLYAVRIGKNIEGIKAELVLEGNEPRTDAEYPHEFTVYPWSMDKDMTFKVKITGAEGKSVETETMTLDGTD
ncbi:hypothetical protein HQ520_13965 [bacterium]|nr:hypothetical protein [bacterium]